MQMKIHFSYPPAFMTFIKHGRVAEHACICLHLAKIINPRAMQCLSMRECKMQQKLPKAFTALCRVCFNIQGAKISRPPHKINIQKGDRFRCECSVSHIPARIIGHGCQYLCTWISKLQGCADAAHYS